jgi:hypothetical protein
VTYFHSGSGTQFFVRASSATGEDWNEPVVVDDTINVHQGGVLLGSGLDPLVIYNAENRTRALKAGDANGDTWVPPASLVDDAFASAPLAAQRPMGLPALARVIAGGDLQYVLARDGEGAAWNVPELIDGNVSGLRPALLQIPPVTYCAYFSADLEVKVARFY